ncbi:MAG: lysophospholipid acyltransferase family protein [Mucinivorans sp.]
MTYYLVIPLFYLVCLLPRRAQNSMSSLFYWVLYRVVHYRVKVVRSNLENSFPEKSEAERMEIERKFYHHLADVFLETILLATMSAKEIKKRIEFINVEQIERYTAGRSWIAAMAHYGSWEYTISWGLHSKHDKVLAVYRPLVDKGFDRYFRRTRSRFGVDPVAMESVARELVRYNATGTKVTLALIADQNPPRVSPNWLNFLGQPTLFFNGMEKLAHKFQMPVAFMHVDKFDNGHYKAWMEVIYDGNEKLPDGEITRRYAAKLEEMIRERPELWMWSHRRWKHVPPSDADLF